MHLLASGQQIDEGQKDLILADAGKTPQDLQADIKRAVRDR